MHVFWWHKDIVPLHHVPPKSRILSILGGTHMTVEPLLSSAFVLYVPRQASFGCVGLAAVDTAEIGSSTTSSWTKSDVLEHFQDRWYLQGIML